MHNSSVRLWYLTNHTWHYLDRLFLQINVRFSVEIKVGLIFDRLLFFHKRCFYLIYKMGPKNGRKNVRTREVPIDTHAEFELGDTAGYIQRRGGENRERDDAARIQVEEREMEESRRVETPVTDRGGSDRKEI